MSKIMFNSQVKARILDYNRWKEIQDTVDYQAQMTGLLKAPTKFRLFNNPVTRAGMQDFGITDKGEEMI